MTLNTITDDLGVLNYALGILGEDEVTAFEPDTVDPDTDGGYKTARFYAIARDEVQASFYWQELVEQTTLSVGLPAQDEMGRYRYPLPADCLRPMGVLASTTSAATTTWHSIYQPQDSNILYLVRGDHIVTYGDGSDLNCSYIARETDPANWSPELTRTVAHNLAALAADLVTQDPEKVARITQQLEALVRPYNQMLQVAEKTNDQVPPDRRGIVMGGRSMNPAPPPES